MEDTTFSKEDLRTIQMFTELEMYKGTDEAFKEMLLITLRSVLRTVEQWEANELEGTIPFIVSQLEFLDKFYTEERKRK